MWGEEGERVSNGVLYILYNTTAESNVTYGLAHMSKPRSQPLYFSPDYESRDIFRDLLLERSVYIAFVWYFR